MASIPNGLQTHAVPICKRKHNLQRVIAYESPVTAQAAQAKPHPPGQLRCTGRVPAAQPGSIVRQAGFFAAGAEKPNGLAPRRSAWRGIETTNVLLQGMPAATGSSASRLGRGDGSALVRMWFRWTKLEERCNLSWTRSISAFFLQT